MRQKVFFQRLRICLFTLTLGVGFVLGLILPLRPAVSESEGRELTRFPRVTLASLLSGEFTAGISQWYADTYPCREELMGASHTLKGLYGIGSGDFSGYGGVVDTIDPEHEFVWAHKPLRGYMPPAEAVDGYYIEGDTCWQLYFYKRNLTDRYSRVVVQAALELEGVATVYSMVVPTACCYGLTPEKLAELGASNGLLAVEHIYDAIRAYSPQAGVETPVVILPVHEELARHTEEELYFRTDHHWTATGAYYASRYFLNAVGRPYPPLEAYDTFTYDTFLGSLYRHTNNEGLKAHPDTLTAYLSPTVTELIVESKGERRTVPLIHREITSSNKYLTFCSGDHAYYEVHNDRMTDGSAVLIVRESYGNAFIPLLADSYEYVYAVDYRFWEGDLAELARVKGVDTVLFLNNLMATGDSYTVSCLERLVE